MELFFFIIAVFIIAVFVIWYAIHAVVNQDTDADEKDRNVSPRLDFSFVAKAMKEIEKDDDDPVPATDNQFRAVAKIYRDVPEDLSKKQAGAILSARSYGECAIYRVIGEMDNYPGERNIEAGMAAAILGDKKLRDAAIAWNAKAWREGRDYDNREDYLPSHRDKNFQNAVALFKKMMDESDKLSKAGE